jgi:L,D-peptidoglycan transpeptidase YkuD (ErfK/YbiS/YcfS/YnhG family)
VPAAAVDETALLLAAAPCAAGYCGLMRCEPLVAVLAAAVLAAAGSGAASAAPAVSTQAREHAQGQLIVVRAAAYGDTYATLTAYTLANGHRRAVFGPWIARIGYRGFTPPGQKREGDGRTPSGSYGFGFMFGVLPDPGVRYPYRRVYSYDVWDDDPTSPLYDEWVDDRVRNPGRSPEPMDQSPAYDYGAVIAYNPARTPGRGSAIFLHVGGVVPTTGCVSLPMGELLDVLRWLNPARSPHIEMGVGVRPAGVPAAMRANARLSRSADSRG